MRVKANVILARCDENKKLYGIRIQEKNGDWIRTWAFPIKEEIARQEGFDKVEINGSFAHTEDFPGCPYCHTKQFFVCGKCRKINCWHGQPTTTCQWCGNTGQTKVAEKLDVRGGGY